MEDTAVWGAVDAQRATLIELVDGIGPDEWDTPSLCAGWTIRHVVAHLTMATYGLGGLIGLAVRHPGGTNRLIERSARGIARRRCRRRCAAPSDCTVRCPASRRRSR